MMIDKYEIKGNLDFFVKKKTISLLCFFINILYNKQEVTGMKQYLEMCQYILENGEDRDDRTGCLLYTSYLNAINDKRLVPFITPESQFHL